jgi:hypothetical protein
MFAALGAAGLLVGFAWAANPAESKEESADLLEAKPSSGRLFLTPTGVTELGNVLGDACAKSAGGPTGIAVLHWQRRTIPTTSLSYRGRNA